MEEKKANIPPRRRHTPTNADRSQSTFRASFEARFEYSQRSRRMISQPQSDSTVDTTGWERNPQQMMDRTLNQIQTEGNSAMNEVVSDTIESTENMSHPSGSQSNEEIAGGYVSHAQRYQEENNETRRRLIARLDIHRQTANHGINSAWAHGRISEENEVRMRIDIDSTIDNAVNNFDDAQDESHQTWWSYLFDMICNFYQNHRALSIIILAIGAAALLGLIYTYWPVILPAIKDATTYAMDLIIQYAPEIQSIIRGFLGLGSTRCPTLTSN